MTRRRSTLALAALGAVLALAVPVAATTLAPSPGAAGTAGTAGATQSAGAPTAEADPSTAGTVAVHEVTAGTDATPNETTPRTNDAEPNATVRTIRLTYAEGANVSLARVEADFVRPYVVRGADTADPERESLNASSVSVGDRTVTVRLARPADLDSGDAVGLKVVAVRNPPTPGPLPVALTLVSPAGNRTTARAVVDVGPRIPELADRGDRLAVSWPGDVAGLLVARTADGRPVEVDRFDPAGGRNFEVPYERFLSPDEADGPVTLNVTAYRDVDGDGEFDPDVDRPFRRNGAPVSVVEADVSPAPETTTSTISTITPSSTAPATTTPTATPPTGTPAVGDDGPLTGGLAPAAVLGLCAGLLLAVVVGRRLRPGG